MSRPKPLEAEKPLKKHSMPNPSTPTSSRCHLKRWRNNCTTSSASVRPELMSKKNAFRHILIARASQRQALIAKLDRVDHHQRTKSLIMLPAHPQTFRSWKYNHKTHLPHLLQTGSTCVLIPNKRLDRRNTATTEAPDAMDVTWKSTSPTTEDG